MWKYDFEVPENKKIRLIVHTDCKNEADDQYALAHHLMTPRFDIRGIVAGHFWKNPQEYGELGTAKASYDEVLKVMDLMGLANQYPVLMGAQRGLEDETTPIPSDGAKFIVEEAMKEDTPLYIACQGAVTDVASALLLKPEIAERIVIIWIGGASYPDGGFEFNLMMDINAANVIFSSKAELWQVPMDVYKQFGVSLAELQLKVKPCGEIGKYLFEQLVQFNKKAATTFESVWPHGELWGLGDQATIAVLMEELEKVSYDMIKAPRIDKDMHYIHGQENREIRVYRTAETRLTLEDFFAKLMINFGA